MIQANAVAAGSVVEISIRSPPTMGVAESAEAVAAKQAGREGEVWGAGCTGVARAAAVTEG